MNNPSSLIFFTLTLAISCCITPAQETDITVKSLAKIDLKGVDKEKLLEIESQLIDRISDLQSTGWATLHQLHNHQSKLDELKEIDLRPEELKLLNEERRTETLETAVENAEFLAKFNKYITIISQAKELEIFEGLPRGTKQQLKKIKDENKTVEIDGWSFYAEPLKTKPSTIEDLRLALISYQLFEPYSGPKFCGGFHPDFCVEFKTDDKTYFVQICFGCEEAAFIAPSEKMVFDFNRTAWKTFADIAISTLIKHVDGIKKMDEFYSTLDSR